MKSIFSPRIAIVSSLLFAFSAQAECDRPWPVEVPDGKVASKEEVLEAQGKVKSYMADGNAYLTCLEEEGKAVEVDTSDPASVEAAQAAQDIRTRQHNAMIDEMEVVAERFNQTVRDFKAR